VVFVFKKSEKISKNVMHVNKTLVLAPTVSKHGTLPDLNAVATTPHSYAFS
jgi:hypothetical protein